MGISNKDMKKLFGKSAGRCNICGVEVFDENVVVGEMAHVIPRKKGGPRGEYQCDGDVDSIENIILLCLKHHKIVDDMPAEYPPERLYAIKGSYEKYVKERMDQNSFRRDDISALGCLFEFIPFLNMVMYVEMLPERVDVDFFDFIEQFDLFAKSNMHLYPFHDPDLQQKFHDLLVVQRQLNDRVYELKDSRGAMAYDRTVSLGSRHVAYLNRDILSDQEFDVFTDDIKEMQGQYSPAYSAFMAYVKEGYPEVNMNAWTSEAIL